MSRIPSTPVFAITSHLMSLRSGAASMFASNINNGNKLNKPIQLAALSSPGAQDVTLGGGKQADFSRLGLFINGAGSSGKRDTTYNPSSFTGEAGFDFDTWGVLGGADCRVTDNLVLGIAAGYASTDADVRDQEGNLDVDGYNISVYGTYYAKGFYFDAVLGFGKSDYDAERNIVNAAQDIKGIAESKFDGWQYTFSLGTGYDFTRGGLTFGPYARLNYLRARIDGYSENVRDNGTTAGVDVTTLGLQVGSQDITSLMTDIGAQASYSLSTPFGVLVPHIRLGWEHEFDNYSRDIQAQFINDNNRNTFTVPTDSPDRNFFNLGVGLSAVFPHGITAFVDYETLLGFKDIRNHNITVGLRFEL